MKYRRGRMLGCQVAAMGGPVATPPANTVAPAITGTPTVGQTLTASTGTWTSSSTFAYQWNRNGVNIGGATASTYVVTVADIGTVITVTVTATNGGGSTPATSAGTSAVAGASLKFNFPINSQFVVAPSPMRI